jgi:hypothetical protein
MALACGSLAHFLLAFLNQISQESLLLNKEHPSNHRHISP